MQRRGAIPLTERTPARRFQALTLRRKQCGRPGNSTPTLCSLVLGTLVTSAETQWAQQRRSGPTKIAPRGMPCDRFCAVGRQPFGSASGFFHMVVSAESGVEFFVRLRRKARDGNASFGPDLCGVLALRRQIAFEGHVVARLDDARLVKLVQRDNRARARPSAVSAADP